MIIGFAGRARHGKDHCASHAQKLLREKAVTRGFAQSLKERVARALPEFRHKVYEKPKWMRDILQATGNGVREADEEFWVRDLFKWYENFGGSFFGGHINTRHLLVPDVRYPNEVEAIKARGGKVIKVVRMDKPPHDPQLCIDEVGFCVYQTTKYLAPGVNHAHPSESTIDTLPDETFDAIIIAETGMLGYLEQMVEDNLRAWGLL